MPFDAHIDRTGASALMPEEVATEMLGAITEQSAALTLSTRVAMSRKQNRIPVLATLPQAYFLNGDMGLKQTTSVSWDNVFLTAEEIAVMVPIPEAVLDDAAFDVWAQVRPLLEAAIARALDEAVFFGVNKPATWPAAIVSGATTASKTVTIGDNPGGNPAAPDANEGGVAQDILDLFGLVEQSGYDVSGIIASTKTRALLRSVRDSTGRRMMDEVTPTQIEGVGVSYPMRGLWPTGSGEAALIAGDFRQSMIGVRQDVTYKVIDQGVIQGADGAIAINLPQQDSVALRVVARYGWALPNPINYEQPVAGSRYPFAVLKEA